MKRCLFSVVALVAACSVRLQAADGVWYQPMLANYTYSDATCWIGGAPASDGGKLTFLNQNECAWSVNLNGASVTLGGIDFGNGRFTVKNGSLTLSGTGDIYTEDWCGPSITATMTLEAGADITKRGRGCVNVHTKLGGAGKLTVADGTFVSKAPDAFVSDGPIALESGRLEYAPTSPSASVGCGAFTYGPDRAGVKVTKGSAASLTVTFGALSRHASGGFLDLRTSAGTSALGVTEKYFVTDRASDAGFIDASVICRGTGAVKQPVSFLKYDATNGFVPTETAALVDGQSADGKVAVVSTDMTVTQNTSVSALAVTGGAELTIAEGVTLTVGDGVHPAGVLFEGSVADGATKTVHGPGVLAFKAGSSGLVYVNYDSPSEDASDGKSPKLRFDGVRLVGTAGVTFAGTANALKEYDTVTFASAAVCGWTGGTVVLSCRLSPGGAAGLKALSGPVALYGSRGNGILGGGIRQFDTVDAADPLTQDFELSGGGTGFSQWNHDGIFDWGGGPSVTFAGRWTLRDDIAMRHDNIVGWKSALANGGTCNVIAAGGITGPGGIVMPKAASSLDIVAPSDYAGATTIADHGAAGLFISGAGTPGTGPITVAGPNGRLVFRYNDGTVATGDITTPGELTFYNSTNVSLLGAVSAGRTSAGQGLTLGVGRKGVSLGEVAAIRPVSVTAAEDEAVVRIGGAGADGTLPLKLTDGEGGKKLNVEKIGSDTVTLNGTTFTGTLRVREGAVRLSDDIFSSGDVVYWLDASDATTLTLNGSGQLVQWVSKVDGAPLVFKPPYEGRIGPTQKTEANGLKSLTFSAAAKHMLVGCDATGSSEQPVEQRTVVMVLRSNIAGAVNWSSYVFGQWDASWAVAIGQKWGKGGWDLGNNWNASNPSNKGGFDTTNGLRLDGVQRWDTSKSEQLYGDGQMIVMTMRHESDIYNSARFVPAIGGLTEFCFDGDIAEVIAFARVLTEDEMKAVENSLAEKWGFAKPHPSYVATAVPALSGEASVEIVEGARLDLAGTDVTVKALKGAGKIVNSSDRAVTLTVTGANDFRGEVSGKVTLKTAAAAVACALRDGAGLSLTADATTLGVCDNGIVTNGLVYYLNASDASSVTTNAQGRVSRWASRGGTVANFYNNGTTWNRYECPQPRSYDATAVRGKPGVRFADVDEGGNFAPNALISSSAARIRTIMLVGKLDLSAAWQGKNGNAAVGLWTMSGEHGLIHTGDYSGGTLLRTHAGTSIHRYGGLFRSFGVNAVTGEAEAYDYTYATSNDAGNGLPFGDFKVPGEFVLFAEVPENSNDLAAYNDQSVYLGTGYHGSFRGWIATAAAWNRALTEDEIATMSGLMRRKYFSGESFEDYRSVLADDTPLCAVAGSTLTAATPLVVNDLLTVDCLDAQAVSPFVVDGDLTLGTSAHLAYVRTDRLRRGVKHDTISVTGSIAGDFATVAVPRRFTSGRTADGWCLNPLGFLLLLK